MANATATASDGQETSTDGFQPTTLTDAPPASPPTAAAVGPDRGPVAAAALSCPYYPSSSSTSTTLPRLQDAVDSSSRPPRLSPLPPPHALSRPLLPLTPEEESRASVLPAVPVPQDPSAAGNGDQRPAVAPRDFNMSGQHHQSSNSRGMPSPYPASSSSFVPAPIMPRHPHDPHQPTPTARSVDAFRPAPVPSMPMSLPSMRTIDPMQQHQQLHHHHQQLQQHHHQQFHQQHQPQHQVPPRGTHPHIMPMPPNLQVASSSSAMSPQGPVFSHQTQASHPSYDAYTSYQLPHDPHAVVHRAGPKKDIKRRTKTGCLTCRKRRIKCDEGHPTCNNCKKSKRDCMGYDPIFRQSLAGQSHVSSSMSTPRTLAPLAPSPPSSVGPSTADIGGVAPATSASATQSPSSNAHSPNPHSSGSARRDAPYATTTTSSTAKVNAPSAQSPSPEADQG